MLIVYFWAVAYTNLIPSLLDFIAFFELSFVSPNEMALLFCDNIKLHVLCDNQISLVKIESLSVRFLMKKSRQKLTNKSRVYIFLLVIIH